MKSTVKLLSLVCILVFLFSCRKPDWKGTNVEESPNSVENQQSGGRLYA